MWSNHVDNVGRARKLGAQKAAFTRSANNRDEGNFTLNYLRPIFNIY